jgi:two-component system, response regulator YesN
MAYKIFLVEDEIVTREGIRDSVDWAAAGYEFCGEAPDGELALPLIRERRPETVITDIKMPFMDGLQLCRRLKETLPATKIIILSGHDEFRFAQEAIQVGVTEYLLKPIVPQDLLAALRKVAQQIDQEREASAQLQALRAQMADHRSMLRERSMLDLLTGYSSAADCIEQCRSLDIDLLAPCYQVLVLHVEAQADDAYGDHQQLDALIAATSGPSDSIIRLKKSHEETVLILKGESADQLARRSQALSELLRQRIAEHTSSRVRVGVGLPTDRIGTIAQSFSQALRYVSPGDQRAPDGHDHDPPAHSHRALINKARAYIDLHYADTDISLSAVAAHVLLSPSYFSVVFGREVGETFIEYLTNVRIRKAIELLHATSLTSSEIAYRVGYHNPRYFYSVFRKVTGLPPNEFRRRM